MKELFKQYFKHTPNILKYCFYVTKLQYKTYLTVVSIMLLLLLITITQLFLRDAIDIQRTTAFYKLIGMYAYICIFIALYFSEKSLRQQNIIYKRTSVPYFVGSSAHVFLMLFIFLVVTLICGFVAKLNTNLIDINILGFVYYFIMAIVILIPIAAIISILGDYFYKTRFIVFGFLLLLFILVPIAYVPHNMFSVWVNILKINPFFYIINGFQQTMVLGEASVTNLFYHAMFFFEIAFIYLIWINLDHIYKTQYFK